MIKLPKDTYTKIIKIPKKIFYEKLEINSDLKRIFVENIESILWKNKIVAENINVADGKEVSEIHIFYIQLNKLLSVDKVFRQIDKVIPYHIIFVLEYENKYQAWIGYKEATLTGNNAFKVEKYYHTEWKNKEDLTLSLEGLDLDKVYENFVRQIAGDKLEMHNYGESLKETISREEERKTLEYKINVLEGKIKKENQFNRQVEMNSELKVLKKQLEEINGKN